MKVTKLKYTKRGNRVSIYIDEEFILSIEKNLIVDLEIFKGKQVTGKDIKEWKNADLYEKLYGKVIDLIARRPRSRKEIENYLRVKLYKVKSRYKITKRVISKLKNKGYIDDHKFASWWVSHRILFKPRGKFLIIQELRQKGVNSDIISEALEEAGLDSESEMKYALELGRKKKRSLDNLEDEKKKRKFFNFLSRKGFVYSTIRKVYEKLKVD